MREMNDYPIEETVNESYKRFVRMYTLTNEVSGMVADTLPVKRHIRLCWRMIAEVWENEIYMKHKVRIFEEALYHIRHRVFSQNLQDPLLLKLVLLVEDELGRCGYAFNVWNDMDEFRMALCKIQHPRKGDLTYHRFYTWWFREYLDSQMLKYVALKNREPEKWQGTLCLGGQNIYECSRPDIYRHIECFETVIKFLLPDACDWYEQWRDEFYILEQLNHKFGVDFKYDYKGFDALIQLVLDRNNVNNCASCMYRMKMMTPALAQHIWGSDADGMIGRCFIDIYKRYRKSKKNRVRSRYSQTAVVNGWMYKQIQDWYENQPEKLTDKVRKVFFNISIGI